MGKFWNHNQETKEKMSEAEKKLLRMIETASKIVMIEDKQLLEELAKK